MITAKALTDSKYCVYAPYHNGVWDGKTRITLGDLDYSVHIDGVLHTIRIPAGFVMDLGSVPSKLRGVVDDNDQSTLGFILHDYLFKADCPYQFPRSVTDKILKRVIQSSGQHWYRAGKTWLGVFLGGIAIKYHAYDMIVDVNYRHDVLRHMAIQQQGGIERKVIKNIIKRLQDKHDVFLGVESKEVRQAFKDGLSWSIDSIKTLTEEK